LQLNDDYNDVNTVDAGGSGGGDDDDKYQTSGVGPNFHFASGKFNSVLV
jgi:hypothetical protein